MNEFILFFGLVVLICTAACIFLCVPLAALYLAFQETTPDEYFSDTYKRVFKQVIITIFG